MSELIGKVVVRMNASTGEVLGTGECVGYLREPSYLIRENGRDEAFHWAASITREARPHEELHYLRKRVFELAGKVREMGGEA